MFVGGLKMAERKNNAGYMSFLVQSIWKAWGNFLRHIWCIFVQSF
jgi:hypothetical protein